MVLLVLNYARKWPRNIIRIFNFQNFWVESIIVHFYFNQLFITPAITLKYCKIAVKNNNFLSNLLPEQLTLVLFHYDEMHLLYKENTFALFRGRNINDLSHFRLFII